MKHLLFVAICCMVMLAGCQQAEEIMNPSEELVLSIEADIEKSVESRYANANGSETPNNLEFVSGDKIGVFMDNKAVTEWTRSENGSWGTMSGSVYWPDESSVPHNFYAFYPYPIESSAFTKENVPMPSLANQNGTITSLSACDFMVATAEQSYSGGNGTVSFTGETNCFKHVSSLVAITILKESDLKESVINKISFEGTNTNLGALTSYSFETETVSVKTAKDKMESADLGVSMAEEESDKTLYFILNSGASLSDVTFSIKYKTEGIDYIATKSNLGNSVLTKGNRYNFNLNITDGVLDISGCEIQGWGEGEDMGDIIINTPVVSPNNEND